MSLDATRWAWQQKGIRAADKFVLVSLADRADEKHCCYPSIARLSADTLLDRKTVLASISRLEAAGLVSADRRHGESTKYLLVGVSCRHETSTENGTSPKNGTGTKNGTPPVPKTVPPPVPKTGHESTTEPTKNRKSKSAGADDPVTDYAFTGETIRITLKDFGRLAAQYPRIDLMAELTQLDLELRGERKWWHALNSKLNYRNRKAANGNGDRPGSNPSSDRSAAGRVRAKVAAERAAWSGTRAGADGVAAHGFDVRDAVDGEFR